MIFSRITLLCYVLVISLSFSQVCSLLTGGNDDFKYPRLPESFKLSVNELAKDFVHDITALENKYESVRKSNLTKQESHIDIIQTMLDRKGIPERLYTKYLGKLIVIPTGFNIIAPDNIVVLPSEILFFHRMKLRDNTRFAITHMDYYFSSWIIHAELFLDDLVLRGEFDSMKIVGPSQLFHIPIIEEAEIRLKKVTMRSEIYIRSMWTNTVARGGRVALISSVLDAAEGVTLTFLNSTRTRKAGTRIELAEESNIENLKDKIKVFFNEWLQNYLNDVNVHYNLNELEKEYKNVEMKNFDKGRLLLCNKFVDDYISKKKDMALEGLADITLENFSIETSQGAELKLLNGKITGVFSSLYRRGVAVGKVDHGIRVIEAVVGFSDLKVKYDYEAITNTGYPQLQGRLMLSADQLTAHLRFLILNKDDTVTNTYQLSAFEPTQPVSLILEGPLMRVATNFYPIVDLHVTAILTTVLKTALAYEHGETAISTVIRR